MLLAFLATLIWTCSSWFTGRGARHLSGVGGNLVRMSVSVPLMIVVAACAGTAGVIASSHAGGAWFLLSGVLGMGLCDILLLHAFSRIGLRLPSLLVNGMGALTAIVVGHFWLGEALNLSQIAAIAVVLSGMAIAVWPARDDVRFDGLGLSLAACAGVLFGMSSVLSRHGYAVAAEATSPMHWIDATVLRLLGGLAITSVAWVAMSWTARALRDGKGEWRAGAPWLAANGVIGAGLGVSILQWALQSTDAAIVQAVIATLPAFILLFTWALGEGRPSKRSLLGTIICVEGAAVLALVTARS